MQGPTALWESISGFDVQREQREGELRFAAEAQRRGELQNYILLN